MPSQKDNISSILAHVKAQEIYLNEMKVAISELTKKQEIYSENQAYFSSLLENNDSIGRMGYIQKVDELDDRVENLETTNKITAGKVAIATTIFLTIGTIFLKVIGLIKL